MLSDYQEKIIWSEHSSKPATRLMQFFGLVRHFLKSFSGRASLIQKLHAALQCPTLTSLPFLPTAPVALAVLTFGTLWERNMPQGLHKHVASLWSGHSALCCQPQNSGTDTEHSALHLLTCSTAAASRSNQAGATQCHARLPLHCPPAPEADWDHLVSPAPGRGVPLHTPALGASPSRSLWRSHLNSVLITFFHASVTGSNSVHLQKGILFEDIWCHSCPPVSSNSVPLPWAVLPNPPCRNVCGAQASTLNLG